MSGCRFSRRQSGGSLHLYDGGYICESNAQSERTDWRMFTMAELMISEISTISSSGSFTTSSTDRDVNGKKLSFQMT